MKRQNARLTKHPTLRDSVLWSGILSKQMNSAINLSLEMAENSEMVEKYKRFTPAAAHRHLSKIMITNEVLLSHSETLYASVLMADISGFTRLSSRLSAEELKHHINEYFSTLLGIVKGNGGDVVKFLGDAVLIIFPINEDSSPEVKSATVLMASLCALRLVKECGNYIRGEGDSVITLKLHCGIGCGLVHCMYFGEGERWEFVVSGEPLFQVGKAMSEAGVGEVFLSEIAHDSIKEHLEAKRTSGGNYSLTGRYSISAFCNNNNNNNNNIIPSERRRSCSREQRSSRSPYLKNVEGINKHLINIDKRNSIKTNTISIITDPEELAQIKRNNRIHSFAQENTGTRSRSITNSALQDIADSSNNSPDGNCNDSASQKYIIDNKILIANNNIEESGSGQSSPVTTAIQRLSVELGLRRISSIFLGEMLSSYSIGSRKSCRVTTTGGGGEGGGGGEPDPEPENTVFSVDATTSRYSLISERMSHRTGDTFSKLSPKSTPPCRRSSRRRRLSTEEEFFRKQWMEENIHVQTVRSFLVDYLTPDKNTPQYVGQNNRLATVLKYFVHDAARSALESNEAAYLFELRNVTTLFIELLGLEAELNAGEVERPQKAVLICMHYLRRFGGSLRQFTVDDKGCVFIAAFGLPGSSHEDNSRRAIETALSINKSLAAVNISARAGIAEGRVFCGLVGSAERCEYAMMGCSVNLAARLMGKCNAGEVLVSETVYLASHSAFLFSTLPPVKAKGYSTPVAVYLPTERACGNILVTFQVSGNSTGFVGRNKEMETIKDIILNVRNNAKFTSIIIDGPPGIGKTRLVIETINEVTEESNQHVLKVFNAVASSAFSTSTYYIVRQLLQQLFNIKLPNTLYDGAAVSVPVPVSPTERPGEIDPTLPVNATRISIQMTNSHDIIETIIVHWVQQHLPNHIIDITTIPPMPLLRNNHRTDFFKHSSFISNYSLSHSISQKMSFHHTDSLLSLDEPEGCCFVIETLLPLLNDILGCNFTQTKVITNMSVTTKRKCTEALIINLLVSGFMAQYELLLVDNLQWCDWKSLRILLKLIQIVPSGVLLCTVRTLLDADALTPSRDRTAVDRARRHRAILTFKNMSSSVLFTLAPLLHSEIRIIIERTIGLSLLQSYPNILSDNNITVIMERSGGSPFHVLMLATGLKNALITGKFTSVLDLPTSENNLIVSRFDRLEKSDQVVIKTAAVIGMSFSEEELLYTLTELKHFNNIDALKDTLLRLKLSSLIVYEENIEKYSFVDRSIQENIYNLMLATQRDRIHKIFGNYLESLSSANVTMRFDELVHHYSLSNDNAKKIEYLSRARDFAREEFAYYKVYKYVNMLVRVATGYDVEQLLLICSKMTNKNNKNTTLFQSLYQRAMQSYRRMTHALRQLTRPKPRKSRNWSSDAAGLQTSSRKADSKVWYSVRDFTAKAKLRKADSMLGASIDITTLASWFAELGIAQFMQGNLLECSNLSQFSLYHIDHPPGLHATPWSSRFTGPRSSHPALIIPTVNQRVLNIFVDLLECQLFIYLLRGLVEEAWDTACTLSRLVTSNTDQSKLREAQGTVEAGIHIRSNALGSIAMVAYSRTDKDRERAKHLFNKAQEKTDKKYFTDTNCKLTFLFSLAIHSMNLGEWSDSSEYLRMAAVDAGLEGQRFKQCIALLGHCWCSFLQGNILNVHKSLTSLIEVVSVESFTAVHVWALELDILMKTFSNDVEGAEEAQRLIRTLRRRTHPSTTTAHDADNNDHIFQVTTSAVIAFSRVWRNQYDIRTCTLAVYACTHLMERKQGFIFGGIFLFLAIYAVLECAQHCHLRKIHKKKPFLRGFRLDNTTNKSHNNNNNNNSIFTSSSSYNRDYLVEVATEGVNALIDCSERFPGLECLVCAIDVKLKLVVGIEQSAAFGLLKQLNGVLIDCQHQLGQYVFANTFLHLQRFHLCNKLKLPTTYNYNNNINNNNDNNDSKTISRNGINILAGINFLTHVKPTYLDDDVEEVEAESDCDCDIVQDFDNESKDSNELEIDQQPQQQQHQYTESPLVPTIAVNKTGMVDSVETNEDVFVEDKGINRRSQIEESKSAIT